MYNEKLLAKSEGGEDSLAGAPEKDKKRKFKKEILRDFVDCLREWFNMTIQQVAETAGIEHQRLEHLLYHRHIKYIYPREVESLTEAWRTMEEGSNYKVLVEKTTLEANVKILQTSFGFRLNEIADRMSISPRQLDHLMRGKGKRYVCRKKADELAKAVAEARQSKALNKRGKVPVDKMKLRDFIESIKSRHGLPLCKIEEQAGFSPQRLAQLLFVERCKNIRRTEIEQLRKLCGKLGEELPVLFLSEDVQVDTLIKEEIQSAEAAVDFDQEFTAKYARRLLREAKERMLLDEEETKEIIREAIAAFRG